MGLLGEGRRDGLEVRVPPPPLDPSTMLRVSDTTVPGWIHASGAAGTRLGSGITGEGWGCAMMSGGKTGEN